MYKYTFIGLVFLGLFSAGASAQRNVTPVLDTVLETDAKRNMEVAKHYYSPLKKAYKAVLERFEETYAAYPEFSAIDEFLYMAGMSSYYLAEGKGKQKVNLKIEREREKYAPEKLRADAVAYLSTIVEKYPESKFANDAKRALGVIETK